MRLATILERGEAVAGLVSGDRVLALRAPGGAPMSLREIVGGGPGVLRALAAWAEERPAGAWRPLREATLGPAVPEPGAIYTIGHNYRAPGDGPADGPPRPLVFGKAASSVGAHGATLAWDRSLTDDVDAECELGVVIGAEARAVPEDRAMDHVLGYTIVNDVSARDPWLDGDQWLLGKSLPGFCPVGPWVVTADELDPRDLAIGCTIDGEPIQDGRTRDMRFGIPAIVAFLSRHAVLRPGDLIATGTPARLATPPGPGRRLRPGDMVTCRIEGIGELDTTIA
jgi:5-carboxymethyl-2-hydroxymuconate isomerase